ncbi:hypothetical protein [Rubrivirga sp. IMCC45206]|uniref:hypothetical protein n=1 Tax=Rubrivirga sp. IMCC45206 TaxID=3391614 RepID=UPI00398FD85C
MASQFLASYASNGLSIVADRTPVALADGDEPNVLQLATAHRQHGVCELLQTGDAGPFFAAEMRAAGAYLHYVRRHPEGGAASRAKPFLDAVAGGYRDAAADIGEVCGRWPWDPDREYQEDALYLQTLMDLVQGADVGPRLAAYEAASAGLDDPRPALVRALAERDAEAFRTAFADVAAARAEQLAVWEAGGVLTLETAAWVRPFHLEGAALVRLAGWLGLDVGGPHPGVPGPVRAEPPAPFDPRAWERVPDR